MTTTAHGPFARALAVLPILAALSAAARADEPTPEAPAPPPVVDAINGKEAFEQTRTAIEADLSEVSSQLEHNLEHDDVAAAEQLYRLERRLIHLLQYAESGDLASLGLSHEETTGGIRSMLQRVLRYQERVKDHAQQKLDKVLPGEPGRKLFQIDGKDHYGPLFRSGTPKPGEEPASDEQRLAEMQKDFTDKGGDVKRDIKLFGLRYLRALPSGQLAEWTQIDEQRISISMRGPKHPVIGGGRKVAGAGSLKVYRDSAGEVVLAIVSNSSGNYKPGVASVEGLVAMLVDLGVREERILTTSVVPEEPELVKLLLKARMVDKQQIDEHVRALRERTKPQLKFSLGRAPAQTQSKIFYASLKSQRAARWATAPAQKTGR